MSAPDLAFGAAPAMADAPPLPLKRSLATRAWRWAAEQWVAHVSLIVLGLLFVFPFVWMIGMSLKTDEEATGTGTFPAVPTFRASSPFVRDAADVDRPESASPGRWDALLPRLKADARARVAALPLPAGTPDHAADALRDAAATEAVRGRVGRFDERLWAGEPDDAKLAAAFADGITDADAAAALDDRLGRLELGNLQVRSLSGRVNPVVQDGKLWSLVSGDASLVPTPGGTQVLKYHFADAASAPVVVRATFDGRVAPDDLHRLLVSLKGDASWHGLDAVLRYPNRDVDMTTTRTTYVAQHRPVSLLMQPPTFQDDTLTPHTWVPLIKAVRHWPELIGRKVGSPADSPTWTTLTLTLQPSSTAQAIWGKVERNYSRAFRSVPFWQYVGNSLVIVMLQMAGTLFSSAFVGYAFARLNWPGRSLATGLLLATMMLPGQVTMIPTFLIWRALGWYNTLNPLWVGAWLGNAFFIFLMVQHMRTIPKELDEAARIDGMNALQTWWYVIVPQVKPTLAAIAILTFMGAWNEFMQPLILLRDQSLFPLSLGLFSLRLDATSDWPLIMAGNLLMTLPVIVIFFLFQRYFIEGVTVTGMKG